MNVTDLLDQHRIKWTAQHRDVRQGWVALLEGCPWCGKRSGELYLSINLHSAIANCWRCGPHSLADVLSVCTRMPLRDAIEAARGVSRIAAPERPTGTLKRPAGLTALAPAHRRYLRQRGFDVDAVEQIWSLQAISIASRLAWRVYIPIFDRNGFEVSWTTRAIGTKPPRYHTASPEEEATPAKSLLFGEQYCGRSIVVHEGPFDAIATGPGATATLGLGVTPEQISRLACYPIRAVCFDAEPEAQKRAAKLVAMLAPFPGETFRVELETGNDPASCEKSEIADLRAEFLGDKSC